jgi:hypothetical protein
MASGIVRKVAPRKEKEGAATTAAAAAAAGPLSPPRAPPADLSYDAAAPGGSSSFFRGNLNKNARTLTLHIGGLDNDARRKLAEDALLQVKGVVSFTFEMAASRVIVRARNEVAPEVRAMRDGNCQRSRVPLF